MLEVLFAHQSQEQAFLAFVVCGVALGLMLHLGASLRRRSLLLSSIWDVLCALSCAVMVLLVLFRFRTGLRAYAVLGLLLGAVLYLAGLAHILQGMGRLFQKYKNSHRPKAGKPPFGDESTVQKDAKG